MTMAPERSEPSLAAVVVREARPRQWLKNVLVFAAPAAAGVLHEGPSLWPTIAFVAMCAAASGAYSRNDIADVEADRRHPLKRFPPVAAGDLPITTAARPPALRLHAPDRPRRRARRGVPLGPTLQAVGMVGLALFALGLNRA